MNQKENVVMTIKEGDRLGIMRQIDKKSLTIREASKELKVCLRQAKRIRKRYLEYGEKGLLSGHRGKESCNKISIEIRKQVMDLIHHKYSDFGPTFAVEKLEENHGLKLSVETLRKWMIADGVWQAKKNKERKVYQRRSRRSCFGEMLQGDGSTHAWFEERGKKCCLIHFIDDATNETTSARFMPTECEEGYLQVLEGHLKKHGRPVSLYVDKHSIFRVNREEIKKGEGITHFGKVLKALDIELICAHSPQAKGRVERNNGILQDRLVKEMRLAEINNIEEANHFLPKFLEKYNKRFKKKAASAENSHRPMRIQDNLKKVFAREEARKLSKNLTFQFQNTLYMLETKTPNRLRYATIKVIWRENEAIEVEYNGEKLKYKKWEEKIDERPKIMDAKQLEAGMRWVNKKPNKPSKHHLWR